MHNVLNGIDGGEELLRAPLRSRRQSEGNYHPTGKPDYEQVRRTLEAQARELQVRRRTCS